MAKILYCPGPFATYNARFLYTQEPDTEMIKKSKDIIETCSKYNLTLHIKVHPSGERSNYAHFKYLTKNYNVKVIGGYWKWFKKAESIIPHYQLVIIDIVRTAILPVMAQTTIPTIIYTKQDLKQWKLEDLDKIFHIVKTKQQLDILLNKFSFGELYLPENEQLMKKWFTKRETIQRWYEVGKRDFFLRRRFRHEWKNDGIPNINMEKLWKRFKRITNPPLKGKI
ncbi:hypothetical protein LCGC14_1771060 [marine sediment metagenome]|uniref:Uncharacterized protein n=1 Tax=marine sediment metagenome TaxID=412755 RepID=A0A0F9HKU5_9ZZZZ